MVVVPAVVPVTIPVLPIVAMLVTVELHVPPAVASLSDVVAPPEHTTAAPDIDSGITGAELTVTTSVAAKLPHPFVSV